MRPEEYDLARFRFHERIAIGLSVVMAVGGPVLAFILLY